MNSAPRASAPSPKEPTTVRECLAPLAGVAVNTAIVAYKLGMNPGQHHAAMRLLELCNRVLDECLDMQNEGGRARLHVHAPPHPLSPSKIHVYVPNGRIP